MIDPIEIKSTGFLIDEYITACFKRDAGVLGAVARADDLRNAIDVRWSSTSWHIAPNVVKLHRVSKLCWDAQDKIANLCLSHIEVVNAARTAQVTNAQRNLLIRKIDEMLDESVRSPLEKTYA